MNILVVVVIMFYILASIGVASEVLVKVATVMYLCLLMLFVLLWLSFIGRKWACYVWSVVPLLFIMIFNCSQVLYSNDGYLIDWYDFMYLIEFSYNVSESWLVFACSEENVNSINIKDPFIFHNGRNIGNLGNEVVSFSVDLVP